jgi:hypothetical protein
MPLHAIFAQLSCSDLGASAGWFSRLFGRGPDAEPMAGLAEWHHGGAAALQLHENAANAGCGVLTLVVDDLDGERARLQEAALGPGPVEEADYTRIVRLRDVDGNLVVLAEPRPV